MKSSPFVRFAALSASAVITLALVQSIALLGHPRHAADKQVTQARTPGAPAAQAPAVSDSVEDADYLPGLFVEEERAARIESLPPQF
jgi:hypothetical protein